MLEDRDDLQEALRVFRRSHQGLETLPGDLAVEEVLENLAGSPSRSSAIGSSKSPYRAAFSNETLVCRSVWNGDQFQSVYS